MQENASRRPGTIAPAPGLELGALLGTWHIVATTLGFWRGRTDATVTYAPLADGRWSDTLRFRKGGAARTLRGTDTPGDPPGRFLWRGAGWLRWCTSAWTFAAVDPAGQWAITWFAAATLRVTPEGMDVYARGPSLDPAVLRDAIARANALRPGLERWRALVHEGVDAAACGLPTSLE